MTVTTLTETVVTQTIQTKAPRRGESQDEDDHMSLKSTEEDELVNLRGSVASLKSLRLDREISHDSVIDEMVNDQRIFYSPTNDSDEDEMYQRKNSILRTTVVTTEQDSIVSH
jgi:hypothetical protein